MSSKALNLPLKNWINLASLAAFVFLGARIQNASSISAGLLYQFICAGLSLWVGYHLVASVGGGDMPCCITVLNSYSGWALVAEGFLLNSPTLTTIGSLIGFSGAILTKIMCDAMNRDIVNVIFGGMQTAAPKKGGEIEEVKEHREVKSDP